MNTTHQEPQSDPLANSIESTLPPLPLESAFGKRAKQSRRRLIGKVARFPLPIRNFVNESIRDAVPYAQLTQQLADKGFPGIKAKTLSRWHQTGYQAWLLQQEHAHQASARTLATLEFIRKLQAESKMDVAGLNHLLLASQVHDILDALDLKALKESLVQDPQAFFKLASTVTAQAGQSTRRQKLDLENQKYRDFVADQKKKIQKAAEPARSKQGLTPQELAHLHQLINLL